MKSLLTLVRIVMLGSFMATSSLVFAADLPATAHASPTDASPAFEDSIAKLDHAQFAQLASEGKAQGVFKSHKRVCDVAGADSAACDARVITDGKGTPATNKTPSGYGPVQFRTAYAVSGMASGKPIIAIVDAYDDLNIASDLATYSSTFNIPSLPTCSGPIKNATTACFQKVNQNGQTAAYPKADPGWSLEIALDVETAHAMCQNCAILLVEANTSSYANLMTAVDTAVALGGNVVSNSYGSNEFNGETAYDVHFNHPGVAFTVSAGDSGYGAEYPAASPYVTAVGGTHLILNANNSYASESVWSGTGSGCSAYESKPGGQTAATGCVTRAIADVSADADPNTGAAVYDTVRYTGQSGWFQVGGTSLAAPLIAATYALSGNLPAGTQENSLPYLPAALAALHDVLSGSNGTCGSALCMGVAGYDGPTGMGSPRGTGAF